MGIAATVVTSRQIMLLHPHPPVCPGGKGHHKQRMGQTKLEDSNGVSIRDNSLLMIPLVALLYPSNHLVHLLTIPLAVLLYLSSHLVHPVNHYLVQTIST